MPTSAPGKRIRSESDRSAGNDLSETRARLCHDCRARPHPATRASRRTLHARLIRSRGFTLIEVVVVLLIITIILGMVGVNLTRDRSDVLRDEAQRLALVLQNAQQQAILEGRPYGFTFADNGYRFLRLNDKGRLVPIEFDELLGPRTLPPPIALAAGDSPEDVPKSTDTTKPEDPTQRRDLIVFDPSGEFPAFTLVLSLGDIFWYVRGQTDGQVLSSPLADASTG